MKKKNKKRIASHFNAVMLTSACLSMFVSAASYAADTSNDVAGSFRPVVRTDFYDLANQSTETTTKSGKAKRNYAQSQNLLNSQLLATHIDLETGHIYDATKTLNSMLPDYPDNVQLLSATANAENYGGNWPYASYLLKKANSISPENQDVSELMSDIRRIHAPGAQIDYDWIKYGSSYENVAGVSGFVNATDHVQIGAKFQDNDVRGRGLRLSNGIQGDANGNREQGELYAQYSRQNGQVIKVSGFENNDTGGAGLYYDFLNPFGQTNLAGEFQRPYWDMPEAILDDATRSRVAFLHIIRPTTRLMIEGGAGLNTYNVRQADDVAKSITADLNVLYRVVQEVKYHKPYIDLGYNIDGEYVKSQDYSIDSSGQNTRILPLFSREIHTPFVDVGYDFNPSTYGDVMAGYEYDRLGGHGPMVAAKITHEFTQMLDVQLRADHSVASNRSENNITSVGGYVRCRF